MLLPPSLLRTVCAFFFATAGLLLAAPRVSAQPIVVGIDGEFGLLNSTSAQAIELGVRVATQEINNAGGLLGGRKITIVTKDHRSIAARGIANIREFAAMPDVVAVFGGRFSPVVIEQLPILREARLPFLAVWSSATGIVDNGSQPNYVFRLSLRDSLAMPFMLQSAHARGVQKIGLLLTNTAWGRSNFEAAQDYATRNRQPAIVTTAWYNWQEKTLVDKYRKLRAGGAQAVIIVANDDEGALLVREVAALPASERIPIISHWGVTGGRFFQEAGPALQHVDFSVIQTFSFFRARQPALGRFMETAGRISPVRRIEDIESPVGVAHAYDMMHILAQAIRLAGTTDRAAVRDALERVPLHEGLVRRYAPPFTPARHEALGAEQLLMARYRSDGVLVPADKAVR
jgi:branched-chain amino acid transport system substrate-binding protein